MFIFFPIRITIIANSHNQTTYQRKGNLYGKKRLGETGRFILAPYVEASHAAFYEDLKKELGESVEAISE